MTQTLPLIGLAGRKGAGKDTAAAVLVRDYGYTRRAFADALKQEIARTVVNSTFPDYGFGVADLLAYMEQHKRDDPALESSWPRLLLQAWGMMRRDRCGPAYWITRVPLEPGTCISDVRMPNEAAAIHAAGGQVWRIVRPGCGGDTHASEIHVDSLDAEVVILNDGSLSDLEQSIHAAMSGMRVRGGPRP